MAPRFFRPCRVLAILMLLPGPSGPRLYRFCVFGFSPAVPVFFLQEWSWIKKAERWLKRALLCQDKRGMSVVPPPQYAERFRKRVIEAVVEQDATAVDGGAGGGSGSGGRPVSGTLSADRRMTYWAGAGRGGAAPVTSGSFPPPFGGGGHRPSPGFGVPAYGASSSSAYGPGMGMGAGGHQPSALTFMRSPNTQARLMTAAYRPFNHLVAVGHQFPDRDAAAAAQMALHGHPGHPQHHHDGDGHGMSSPASVVGSQAGRGGLGPWRDGDDHGHEFDHDDDDHGHDADDHGGHDDDDDDEHHDDGQGRTPSGSSTAAGSPQALAQAQAAGNSSAAASPSSPVAPGVAGVATSASAAASVAGSAAGSAAGPSGPSRVVMMAYTPGGGVAGQGASNHGRHAGGMEASPAAGSFSPAAAGLHPYHRAREAQREGGIGVGRLSASPLSRHTSAVAPASSAAVAAAGAAASPVGSGASPAVPPLPLDVLRQPQGDGAGMHAAPSYFHMAHAPARRAGGR